MLAHPTSVSVKRKLLELVGVNFSVITLRNVSHFLRHLCSYLQVSCHF